MNSVMKQRNKTIHTKLKQHKNTTTNTNTKNKKPEQPNNNTQNNKQKHKGTRKTKSIRYITIMKIIICLTTPIQNETPNLGGRRA